MRFADRLQMLLYRLQPVPGCPASQERMKIFYCQRPAASRVPIDIGYQSHYCSSMIPLLLHLRFCHPDQLPQRKGKRFYSDDACELVDELPETSCIELATIFSTSI